MLTVYGASENQLGSIGGEIGTDITVRPAGSFGGMGSDETLAQEDVDKLSDIDHVVSVQGTIQARYTGDSLQSATESGTTGFGGQAGPRSMGIMIMGVDAETSITDITLMGDAKMTIADGSYFTADDTDANVMVVGQNLADANDLAVGSTVDVEGTSVEVIGIYDSGQVFGNNMIVMPVGTVQNLFSIDGVTSVTVVADDVGNVDGIVTAIRVIFDEDTADIVTASDQYAQINDSVVNAGSTSKIGMIAAFAVAGVVIVFSVVLMVRQRVKEIGILKAIGASNWHIGFQFSMETLAVSAVAAIIGALITFPLAQEVADLLVTDSTITAGPGGFFGGGSVTSIGGLNVAVSPEIFLYALGIAVVLAMAASLFPSWYISRVKPAEVLRYE